jgi:hypothetical protein
MRVIFFGVKEIRIERRKHDVTWNINLIRTWNARLPCIDNLLATQEMLRCIRPRRSVWSHPQRFGTLSSHRLCTFISHTVTWIFYIACRFIVASYTTLSSGWAKVYRERVCFSVIEKLCERKYISMNILYSKKKHKTTKYKNINFALGKFMQDSHHTRMESRLIANDV